MKKKDTIQYIQKQFAYAFEQWMNYVTKYDTKTSIDGEKSSQYPLHIT